MFHVNFEELVSVDNLLSAWKEFLRGKRNKRDVQEFQFALMDNILALHQELINGTYQHGLYQEFKINDPKPRIIHKAMVRDRLLHHAIHRKAYPYFDRTFFSDSFSSRKRQGIHRALGRFRRFGYIVSKNNTTTCWVLKCDIKKFFHSIDHAILIKILKSYLADARTLALLEEIIKSFSFGNTGKGLPLGNLTSQLLCNVYMNEFDQFMKHKLKMKHYIRYADDFVLFSENRELLENLVPRINTFLENNLLLTLHKDKIFMKTLASGVDFLGWVHFFNHGVLRTTTKKKMIRKLCSKNTHSYVGLLSHGNAYTIQQQIFKI